jgi:uncharacterized protein (UPF0335 family)
MNPSERKSLILRIRRLENERLRLDREIARLNKTVWGDARGEFAGHDGPD